MRQYLIGLPACLVCMAPFNPDALPGAPPSRTRPAAAVAPADGKKPLPSNDEMTRLAKDDPIRFLENCLLRYQREVKGYAVMFEKQERIKDTLHKKEVIDVIFREDPHSVVFRWLEGARRAQKALYVEGENAGKLVIQPTGRLLGAIIVTRDPEGEEARDSGRYSLKEFGLKKGTERVHKTWKAAKDNGSLFVEFLGEKNVKEAGDRTCWVLKRSRFQKPESDGVMEVTIYVDKETWLQVGSVIKDKDGELIGAYYFRDLKLNPPLKDEQFKRDALQR